MILLTRGHSRSKINRRNAWAFWNRAISGKHHEAYFLSTASRQRSALFYPAVLELLFVAQK
jgi:hypothetical protein